MNEKNLVVCDKEIRYANGLGENISERKELALRVHACTSVESILQMKRERTPHILIIDESFAYEERLKVQAEQTFVLTREVCKDLGEEEKEVYKFQSADKILAVIFETYYEKTHNDILKHAKKTKRRVLAVYSPIHRIGKTTFAVTLGKELAKKEKTLYLNFEEYSDIDGRFMRAEGRNLGDLLYYMRQEGANVSMRLSTMLGKMEDLDYIPPLLVSTDLKEVAFEEWKLLLEAILNESVYEAIVLDLSESVQGLLGILQLCDKIYMPVLDDAVSKRKLNRYEESLQRLQLTELEAKTYRFAVAEDMEEYARKLVREEEGL